MSIQSGDLPRDIVPSAHGLPLKMAEKFMGPRREIEAVRQPIYTALGTGMYGHRFRELYIRAEKLLLSERRSNVAAKNLDELAGQEKQFVDTLAERILARREAFWAGLRSGAVQAFGKPEGRDTFIWIPPNEWAKPFEDAIDDVHVVDGTGLDIMDAVIAFSPKALSTELEEMQRSGAIYGIPAKQGDENAGQYYRLYREAEKLLAGRVLKGELIVSGLSPDEFVADAWTGELPLKTLRDRLFRLPPPPEQDVVKTKAKGAGGRRPVYAWGPAQLDAVLEFRCESDLEAHGLIRKISDFLLQSVPHDPDSPPSKEALRIEAKKIIAAIERHRASKPNRKDR